MNNKGGQKYIYGTEYEHHKSHMNNIFGKWQVQSTQAVCITTLTFLGALWTKLTFCFTSPTYHRQDTVSNPITQSKNKWNAINSKYTFKFSVHGFKYFHATSQTWGQIYF